MSIQRILALATALVCAFALPASAGGWQSLFNGKNLDGWKVGENASTFSVQDGKLVVKGPRGHLFYVGSVNGGQFTNFEFKAEILTKPKANSGVYFHTQYQETGWPSLGYEVQVNQSHGDPRKTAGLYAIEDNIKPPVKDDEWFTLTIKVVGKHVITKVNSKVISDYKEPVFPPRQPGMEKRLLSHGTFAIQGHDPGSEVHYRNIRVRPLP